MTEIISPYHDLEPGVPHWHRGSASDIPLADDSVPAVVFSPPYNQKITYSAYNDFIPWVVYEARVKQWTREIARVLMPGGRVFCNVMPTAILNPRSKGSKEKLDDGRVPLGLIWQQALLQAGLSYRDTITWIQDSFDGGCAWGSWLSPTAPNLRGSYEIILVFGKGGWKREPPMGHFKAGRAIGRNAHGQREVKSLPAWKAPKEELGGSWEDLARNVWKLPSGHSTVDQPAQFPIELPARCIRLSTWPGELVLDCFAGAGTTGDAAAKLTHPRRALLIDLP